MPVLPLVLHPDPVLRRPCRPVATFDDGLAQLVDDLHDTLDATGGIGLSAPQIGDGRAVFVTSMGEGSRPRVFCNPELVARSTPGLVEESCLSIPGVVGNVVRATEIDVRALDARGRSFACSLSGLEAVCFQHELDHLQGILFIDRLSFLAKIRVRASLMKRRVGIGAPAS